MFMGGLMVAVVIEHSELHRRIALSILKLVGTNPRLLMLGIIIHHTLLFYYVYHSIRYNISVDNMLYAWSCPLFMFTKASYS